MLSHPQIPSGILLELFVFFGWQGHTELVILYIGSLTPMKCTQGRSSCGHGTGREGGGPIYRADLCSNEIAEPVEPLDVRLEVACLLHVFERRLNVGVLLGEGLHEFLGSDERQPLQLDVRQLLRQHQRTGTHFGNVGLKRNKHSTTVSFHRMHNSMTMSKAS
jgi:hypothetical protein